ncbi:MAG TPA: hypothetical protein VMU59_06710 [Caulobacteraceae bacterium]|nr:hypothetical protein [Caulobacteraceae bacterium]
MTGGKLIPLTRGQFATVDAADYEDLARFKWYAVPFSNKSGKYYAVRSTRDADGKPVREWMHRRIARAMADEVVDHFDGDGLNNRRANLRRCSAAQNTLNRRVAFRGPYRGVRRLADGWHCAIHIDGQRQSQGPFATAREAALAYDAAAAERGGDFAVLNFPASGPATPQQAALLMSFDEVSQACGYRPETFRKTWRRLCETRAFPKPVQRPLANGAGGRYAWLKSAVRAWLDQQENPARPAPRRETKPRHDSRRRPLVTAWIGAKRLF